MHVCMARLCREMQRSVTLMHCEHTEGQVMNIYARLNSPTSRIAANQSEFGYSNGIAWLFDGSEMQHFWLFGRYISSFNESLIIIMLLTLRCRLMSHIINILGRSCYRLSVNKASEITSSHSAL